jgi:hypothetical protein
VHGERQELVRFGIEVVKIDILTGKLWVLVTLLAAASFLSGCGGSNNLNVQNPSAPSTAQVAISFNPAPAQTVSLAGTVPLTAVVSNDPSRSGVDWALLCEGGTNCGTLQPLHTASGSVTTYTPPGSITGNSITLTIEAFATADHSSNAVTALTVTAFGKSLKGNYIFATRGEDANGIFQLAGVVVLDGNGNVTSGEQTHNDPLMSRFDAITGGSYYIGPDGRGTLTLLTADSNIGQQGTENLALVVLSNSKALIATLDNPNLTQSFEVSEGTLDLQTTSGAPTGGYAFTMNGVDISTSPMAMGGIMNIDSPNNISGAGSVADQDDATNVTENSTFTGALTSPDKYGMLTFNLTTGFAPTLQFTGYIVDSAHIKLIESDNGGSGSGFGTTAGVAIGQGSATGTFLNTSTFAGAYVFDIGGEDPSGFPGSLGSYGQFSADSAGNLNSGYNDESLTVFQVAISDSFTGTYTLDPSGDGRIDSNVTFSTSGSGPELIFYLTGNGNPPLILDAEDNGNSLAFGSIGTGVAHPQSAPPYALNGKYGTESVESSSAFFNTNTGQVTANGESETLTGVVDTTFSFSPDPDTQITGTFGSIPDTGRFTGNLTNSLFFTQANSTSTIPVAFYPASPDLLFFIETDLLLSGESTFGSFVIRSPVCTGCQ